MSEFTIGELATALSGIVESLNSIAEELGQCDQAAEIVSTEGWSALCSIPLPVGAECVAPVKELFVVADLVETVEGIRDWIGDVQSKLGNYDPATPVDSRSVPRSGETAD